MQDIDTKDIVVGGKIDEDDLYIAPTIIRNIKMSTEQKLMQEEIFGPLLPIIAVNDFQDAIRFTNSMPHALALYIFTKNSSTKEEIMDRTISGSVVVNDAMVQFAQSSVPFGGVGESGMGSYHGKKSFLTFSHERPVVDKGTWLDIEFRYPPYTATKLNRLKHFV